MSVAIAKIAKYVELFLKCVKENPELDFLLTEVGCGLAGHKVEDIAPLFKKGVDLPNITWPKSFVRYVVT